MILPPMTRFCGFATERPRRYAETPLSRHQRLFRARRQSASHRPHPPRRGAHPARLALGRQEGLPTGSAPDFSTAKAEFKATWKALKARTTPEQLASAYKEMN